MAISNISTFKAFRNRDYSLFFTGQSISQIGTWMQRTGVSWLVYTMTHSTFMLGLTVFAAQFPSFLFSVLGGIFSDRYDRYKILMITQIASLIQAILLAVLTLANHYAVWQIMSLSVMLGVINAFDVPARQPLVHQLIRDKSELPNALALNSAMVNLARLLGPALSGIILQKAGAGICFVLNAISFVAVLTSLLLIQRPSYTPPAIKKKIKYEFSEGFHYMVKTPAIGTVILMLSLVCLFAMSYNTLLPVFASLVFKGDAATFGYINSFIGLGAVGGTFFLASLKPGADLKIVLLVNTIILGVCLMLFSHLSYFPLAMIFATLAGFGGLSQTTVCNTIVQVEADAEMRGRMISFMVMAITGMLPLGSLLIGFCSQHLGAQNAIFCQGIMALIIAAVFAKSLRKDRLNKRETAQFEDSENSIFEKI